jgi:hypothetical protein
MALDLQDGSPLQLQDGTDLELQAGVAVVITQQPQDVTVFDTLLGTATFTVVAEPEPLTYQWYEVVAGLLVGETASSLTVPAQLANSGEIYYCDVSGVQSDNATLTVNKANLNFYTQPQNTSVVEATTAEFTVEAAGWEPITYQWYETTAGLLVGETGTSLSFQTSLAQDGNSYYCIVTDGYADTYQSDTAVLSVVAEAGVGPKDIRMLTPSGQWVQLVAPTLIKAESYADVGITGIATGDILLYDSVSGKWTNSQQLQELEAKGVGWRDNFANLTAAATGAGTPTLQPFGPSGNSKQRRFGINDSVYVVWHIDHDVAVGSTAYMHVHWTSDGVDTGLVAWQINFTGASGHNQANFPADTTLTMEQAGQGSAWRHMILEDTVGFTIPEVDSLIIAEVKRVAPSTGSNADNIFGLFVDIHYQVDKYATINRAPNFYE